MDRLNGITMRIGTGWQYLNIDEDGQEIGHIKLCATDQAEGPIADYWAEYYGDKAWIAKIAEFCRLAIISSKRLHGAPEE